MSARAPPVVTRRALADNRGDEDTRMRLSDEQVAFYRRNGYLAGPRVLDDAQIERLRARIADILDRRVPFPDHLLGETVEKSKAKGQLPSFKLVNIFRHDAVFAEVLQHKAIAS